MPDFVNVSFIGAGNLAWHLAPALDNAGYAVREIRSNSSKSAKALVNRLYQAEVKKDLNFAGSTSSIFVVAVNDDEIAEVAREIVLPDDAVLVHTSGAKAIDELSYAACDNTGVFYPLQTFTKSKKVDLSQVPFCIEASNGQTEKLLLSMAGSISRRVLTVDSTDRRALHVAAVISSNFVNHLLAIAEDILKDRKIDFNLLHPLITETIQKGLAIGPVQAQTGPARRHDLETLDQHMNFLTDREDLSEIYRIISQHIIDRYPQQ